MTLHRLLHWPKRMWHGAWRIAEFTSTPTSAVDPPSLYLLLPGHYSMMYSNSAGPRSAFANPDSATSGDKIGAYDTFIANSGDYEIVGDTLVIRPIVSKHPNYMGGGED